MSNWVLSRPVAVADIHGGSEVAFAAGPDELRALAAQYEVLEVRALNATASVTANAAGAIDVAGRVVADIVQACVVTLVPVEQHIDEAFATRFVRPGSPEVAEAAKPNAEVVVDPAAPDPPEMLLGPTFDLGAIVEETFVLAIDPYPRAVGATLPDLGEDAEDAAESPFAVLAGLKRDRRP